MISPARFKGNALPTKYRFHALFFEAFVSGYFAASEIRPNCLDILIPFNDYLGGEKE